MSETPKYKVGDRVRISRIAASDGGPDTDFLLQNAKYCSRIFEITKVIQRMGGDGILYEVKMLNPDDATMLQEYNDFLKQETPAIQKYASRQKPFQEIYIYENEIVPKSKLIEFLSDNTKNEHLR